MGWVLIILYMGQRELGQRELGQRELYHGRHNGTVKPMGTTPLLRRGLVICRNRATWRLSKCQIVLNAENRLSISKQKPIFLGIVMGI